MEIGAKWFLCDQPEHSTHGLFSLNYTNFLKMLPERLLQLNLPTKYSPKFPPSSRILIGSGGVIVISWNCAL